MGVERDLVRLTKQLRENERIWAGFRQIEIRMIGAGSLPKIVSLLVRDLPKIFSSVDCVSLACLDPEYELTRLMDASASTLGAGAFLVLAPETLRDLFAGSDRPQLGPCTPALQSLLFPRIVEPLGSVALAPLVLRGQIVGSLNQGSRDPAHYGPDSATDLLEHLAAVTAMCIENAVTQERLKQDGLTDPLTGIANRRFFERRLEEELSRCKRTRQSLACVLVDVDHFKPINDRFGHQAGDEALRTIARALGEELRGADVLARYGGEEFVLLLPDTTVTLAATIAERLRQRVDTLAFAFDGKRIPMTISLGLACLQGAPADEEVNASALLQRADAALYQAKAQGRNRVCCADH